MKKKVYSLKKTCFEDRVDFFEGSLLENIKARVAQIDQKRQKKSEMETASAGL